MLTINSSHKFSIFFLKLGLFLAFGGVSLGASTASAQQPSAALSQQTFGQSFHLDILLRSVEMHLDRAIQVPFHPTDRFVTKRTERPLFLFLVAVEEPVYRSVVVTGGLGLEITDRLVVRTGVQVPVALDRPLAFSSGALDQQPMPFVALEWRF